MGKVVSMAEPPEDEGETQELAGDQDEDVRKADSPENAVLDFLQSSYAAAARLAGWDRAALERSSGSV